jgi:hypothetical protein
MHCHLHYSFIVATMALKPNTVKQVRELWNEFDAHWWVLINKEVENGGLGADENDPRSQKRKQAKAEYCEKLEALVQQDVPHFHVHDGVLDAFDAILSPQCNPQDNGEAMPDDKPTPCLKCAWKWPGTRARPSTSDETPIYCQECEAFMQASTEWKNREKAKASGSVVLLETLIGKGEQIVEHGAELGSSMSKHTLPNPDAALKSDMRKAFAAACEMRNAAANDGEAITTGILALADALVANQETEEPMNSRIRTRSRSRSRSHNVNGTDKGKGEEEKREAKLHDRHDDEDTLSPMSLTSLFSPDLLAAMGGHDDM